MPAFAAVSEHEQRHDTFFRQDMWGGQSFYRLHTDTCDPNALSELFDCDGSRAPVQRLLDALHSRRVAPFPTFHSSTGAGNILIIAPGERPLYGETAVRGLCARNERSPDMHGMRLSRFTPPCCADSGSRSLHL